MRLISFIIKDQNAVGFTAESREALLSLSGVSNVLIGEQAATCNIVYDQTAVNPTMLHNALYEAGYNCEIDLREPVNSSCCGGCC